MAAAVNGFVATLALAAALFSVEVESPPAPRVASALLLLLLLPGLGFIGALFPARSLTAPEIALLAIALSFSLAIIGALVLHVARIGLTGGSWATFLASVTIAGAATAQARGTYVGDGVPRPTLSRTWLIDGALLGLAFSLVAGAIWLARTPLPAKGVDGYTALWMLPSDRGRQYLDIGVQSSELESTRYRLDVRVGQTPLPAYRFSLATGERWNARLRVNRDWKGVVRARLYRAAEPRSVYRRVRLLVDAKTPLGRT